MSEMASKIDESHMRHEIRPDLLVVDQGLSDLVDAMRKAKRMFDPPLTDSLTRIYSAYDKLTVDGLVSLAEKYDVAVIVEDESNPLATLARQALEEGGIRPEHLIIVDYAWHPEDAEAFMEHPPQEIVALGPDGWEELAEQLGDVKDKWLESFRKWQDERRQEVRKELESWQPEEPFTLTLLFDKLTVWAPILAADEKLIDLALEKLNSHVSALKKQKGSVLKKTAFWDAVEVATALETARKKIAGKPERKVATAEVVLLESHRKPWPEHEEGIVREIVLPPLRKAGAEGKEKRTFRPVELTIGGLRLSGQIQQVDRKISITLNVDMKQDVPADFPTLVVQLLPRNADEPVHEWKVRPEDFREGHWSDKIEIAEGVDGNLKVSIRPEEG